MAKGGDVHGSIYEGRAIRAWRLSDGTWAARTYAFGGVIRREAETWRAAVKGVEREIDAHLRGPLGPRHVEIARNSRGRFTRGRR
jgi:hypothetical protein